MDWMINIAGLLLILLIIWWFWLSKPKAVTQQSEQLDVMVDNGVYTPAHIQVEQGKPLTLRFIRKDASPCAEKVIFDSLNISADLPIDQPVDIQIPTQNTGNFDFTCQMQMYRGKLTVTKSA